MLKDKVHILLIMSLNITLNQMTVVQLRQEIGKHSMNRGSILFSQLLKADLIELMTSVEHKDKFQHLIKEEYDKLSEEIKCENEYDGGIPVKHHRDLHRTNILCQHYIKMGLDINRIIDNLQKRNLLA